MGDEAAINNLLVNPLDSEDSFLLKAVDVCSKRLREARAEIGKEIWGQDAVIDLTLSCLVAGGHLLAVGVPGVAKTRLVSMIAKVMGLDSKRVQFTPDLMPSDILGSEVQKKDAEGNVSLEFVRGPIDTQFLMADEINRAGPRTQSALLEAMQEKQVTSAGKTFKLRQPFTVMATQNPLEQEGTYPLPEAQRDRFLMRVNVDYPDEAAEKRVMRETTGTKENIRELFDSVIKEGADLTVAEDKDQQSKVQRVLGKSDLVLMQKLARSLPLSQKVVDAAVQIVRRARPRPGETSDPIQKFINDNVSWGPGPRAVQAFAQVARARALMDGRTAPTVQDVLDVVQPILEHRMELNFQAKAAGITFKEVEEHLTRGLRPSP